MPFDNWISNRTYDDRYSVYGFDNIIRELCTKTGRKMIDIIDMGCSTGVAARCLKLHLRESGIDCHITGIDREPKVQNEAKANLDKFVLGQITEINLQEKADVVICWAVAEFVLAKRRAEILNACSGLVKADGILITNANCYESTGFHQGLWNWIYWNRYRDNEARRRLRQISDRNNLRVLHGYSECAEYINKVIEGWKKRKALYKIGWYYYLAYQYAIEEFNKAYSK